MTGSTLKTVIGYWLNLLSKYMPFEVGKPSLAGIYNYLIISDTIATSGQPTANQFSLIQSAGYTTIINLAPDNADNAIKNEAEIVAHLHLNYIHIPVDFKKPTADDFAKFSKAMTDLNQQKIWVHCAANMRVSAFIYKYRRDVLNEDEALVKTDLDKIWQPYGVWKQFLFS